MAWKNDGREHVKHNENRREPRPFTHSFIHPGVMVKLFNIWYSMGTNQSRQTPVPVKHGLGGPLLDQASAHYSWVMVRPGRPGGEVKAMGLESSTHGSEQRLNISMRSTTSTGFVHAS